MRNPIIGKVEYINTSDDEGPQGPRHRMSNQREPGRVHGDAIKRAGDSKGNRYAAAHSFTSHLRYKIENRISSNPDFPFVLIAAVFIVLFVLFAVVWRELGETDSDDAEDDDGALFGTQSWSDAFYFSLLMLATGQYDDSVPTSHGYRLVFFIMIFLGPTLIFAVLIGFINDYVQSFMDSLKNGRSMVHEENHTLILGYVALLTAYT